MPAELVLERYVQNGGTVNKLWRADKTPFREIYGDELFGILEKVYHVEPLAISPENITPEDALRVIDMQLDLISHCKTSWMDETDTAEYLGFIDNLKHMIVITSEFAQQEFEQIDLRKGKDFPGLRKNHKDLTITHSLKALSKQLDTTILDPDGEIDVTRVLATVLHDVLEDTDIAEEDLRVFVRKLTNNEQVAQETVRLVKGVTKVGTTQVESQLKPDASKAEQRRTQQKETVSKLLGDSFAEEPRLADVKSADFEDNQDTEKSLARIRQIQRSVIALDFYVPWLIRIGRKHRANNIAEHALSVLRTEWYRTCKETIDSVCTEELIQGITDEVNSWFEIAIRPKNDLDDSDTHELLPFSASVRKPSIYDLYERLGNNSPSDEDVLPIVSIICESEEDARRMYDFFEGQYGIFPEDHNYNHHTLLRSGLPAVKHFNYAKNKNESIKLFGVEIQTVDMLLTPIDTTSPRWALTKEQKLIAEKKLIELRTTFRAAPESILERIQRGQIIVYDKEGVPWPMPKNATVWDFAFSLATTLGEDAIYAKIPDPENPDQEKKVELNERLSMDVQYRFKAPRQGRLLLPTHMNKVTTQSAIEKIHDRILRQQTGDVLVTSKDEDNILRSNDTPEEEKELFKQQIFTRQKEKIRENAILEGRRRVAKLYLAKRDKSADLHFELAFDENLQDKYEDIEEFFYDIGMTPISPKNGDFLNSWEALHDEDRPQVKDVLELVDKLIEIRRTCPILKITIPDGSGQMAIISNTTAAFEASFQVRSTADNTGEMKEFYLPQHVEMTFTKGSIEDILKIAETLYNQFKIADIRYIDNSADPPTEVVIEKPKRNHRKLSSFKTHGFE